LGLGTHAVRKVPVNDRFQIDLQALQAAISADLQAGLHPVCVVGGAGTVNTGAIDDLEALADICRQHGLWFHVDGAFGALAYLSLQFRPMLTGIECADSLAFDLHKWMYMPYDISCILVRNEAEHRLAFTLTPHYLSQAERGLAAMSYSPSDYGPELSRGFRALKVWMSLKAHGVHKYSRLVQQNVEQARYLASLIDNEPRLERLAPVPLNIVCLRYVVPGLDQDELDRLNRELLIHLQESGVAVPSQTVLSGNFALRAAITNHRSRWEDFDLLVRQVIRIGDELNG